MMIADATLTMNRASFLRFLFQARGEIQRGREAITAEPHYWIDVKIESVCATPP